jgi:hypothetical protein
MLVKVIFGEGAEKTFFVDSEQEDSRFRGNDGTGGFVPNRPGGGAV